MDNGREVMKADKNVRVSFMDEPLCSVASNAILGDI